MKSPSLAGIAKALRESEIPPRFQPDESRLLIQLWRLVAEGRPVSPQRVEEVASTLHVPLAAATSFVSKVSERDAEGNIVGIVGLSQKSHPHRFEVNGHTLSTWCAWDSLFLPIVLNQTARVQSSCPATKVTIRLTVTPEKVKEVEPPGAVMSLVVPEVTKSGRESVEEVWMTFCHFVHFFSSPEAASKWFSGKNREPILLSVEEGYRLGRMAFEELLRDV
ncbi:MAG: alkylmercury lyase [candidate division NC10 bacterium]|nr:alkylmercury lyase [candidate division NC10 bacterium]